LRNEWEEYVMKIKNSLNICSFIFLALLFGIAAYAGDTKLQPKGDTGYIFIKEFSPFSITTEKGKFQINEQTKIYNSVGMEIHIGVIPLPGKAKISYVTVNKKLVAKEIRARELYPEEKDEYDLMMRDGKITDTW
jgi:hypothetical protein